MSENSASLTENHKKAIRKATTDITFAAWIDGQSYEGSDRAADEVRDPAAGMIITRVPNCSANDVDVAVNAASEAFNNEWQDWSPAERTRVLFEWLDVLREHKEELTLLECLDTGKPVAHARGEVEHAFNTLEYYAALCRTEEGKQIPARDDVHLYTKHEPYGVVGQILPWNFPIGGVAWKAGPALAAGNTFVLKPAKETPLTTIRCAQLSKDILPDGVVNVVLGGSETGASITEHDDVMKISFTGSMQVGQNVMESAAERIASVTLELGGKGPFLVFPDADMEKVVDATAEGIFYSTGEICDAFSRAIVHEDIAEEFTEQFIDKAESYVLGDPLNEETTMGPLTNKSQIEKVTNYIEIGQKEGANLAAGGSRPDDSELTDGYYIEPTVFTDVDNSMRIAREEIFGPVQTVQTFSSYEEGIKLANDTDYGLSAGIGSESSSIIHNAANDLEAGLVYVNGYGPILPEGPYGGFKQSGFGRDLGKEALKLHQQTKTVYVNIDEVSL